MTSFLQDIRYAFRQLRRSPGFTATAILTLALGIGAVTAMESIVRSTLLAPLPYPAQDQLVGVGLSRPAEPPNAEQTGETINFLRDHASAFRSIGFADDRSLGQNFSSGNGHPQAVRSLRVSAGYLPTLGVAPMLGRGFTAEEDRVGAAPVAILSEALWRRTLNADPAVLGRTIHLNADPYTVVGIMSSASAMIDSPDVWQPLHLSENDPGFQGTNFQLIARLRPGVSIAQAAAEVSSFNQDLLRQFPAFLHWGPATQPPPQENLWPLHTVLVSEARSSLLTLSAAVLMVLLIACLNLAGLVTARSAVRGSELALRAALGAGRASLFRLLLTESLLLAVSGSVLGLVLAQLAIPLLLANSPVELPQLRQAGIGLETSAFALVIGCATALLFGLLPALRTVRRAAAFGLKSARTAGASAAQRTLGRVLVITQVALAMTLLSAGALFLGTFLNLRAIPSGVRTENLMLLQVNLKGTAYNSSQHTDQFVSSVEARLRALPGVSEVATANGLPLDPGLNNTGSPAGHPELASTVETRVVTPGYFHTAGQPILAGTGFTAGDSATSQRVAIINQAAARKWWPGLSPVGEFLEGGKRGPLRIIGVVADARGRTLTEASRPTIYAPFAQVSDDAVAMINGWFPTTFLLRTYSPGSGTLAAAASTIISSVDPEVSVARFTTMQSLVDHSVAAPRFFSWLTGGFALFALLLTLVGLFGLLSFQVASRTREIGLRMALGATRQGILTLVVRNGLALTGLGVVAGVAGSLAIRHVIAALISDTTGVLRSSSLIAGPVVSMSVAASAMLIASLAASFLPARRAASIQPTEALRAE